MFGWLSKKKDEKPLPTSVRMEQEVVRVFARDVEIESFQWDQLESVRVWKQDCFSVDRIWVGFDLAGIDEPVCVHEEVEGYKPLIEEMQRRCPGYNEKWWWHVALPAFEHNHAFIWQRTSQG